MSSTEGKVITCKAAVLWGPDESYVIEEVEVAPPKTHEVRVKMVATGVCHTDTKNFGDFEKQGNFPVIRGHEGAGIVESVGEGVTDFQPGDHVIPLFMTSCNKCVFCNDERTNLCQYTLSLLGTGVLLDGTTRFTCKGKQVYQFMGTSTFSEYTVVADISLCKINKKAPLEKVCLLGCGISTGYGSAVNVAKVRPGTICAVWGLGAVGLAAVMGCKRAGASKIYGIDINPAKFELGKKFGLTDFVNPKDVADKGPLQDYLRTLTQGGFDYTFEAVGNTEIMRTALESSHKGYGVSVIIGVPPYGKEMATKPSELLTGRTWKGAAFGGFKAGKAVPKLVEEYMQKELLLDEFITHTMGLEKINDAFTLMLTGKSIRSVIIFETPKV